MVSKKYVWNQRAGRIYVRIKDKYHRITAAEGTEDFDRQYWAILNGKRAEAKRSWGALVDLFRQADKWAGFSPRYRLDLEPVFAYLIEKIGTADVSRLAQPDIYEAMEKNRHRVRFANYIPTAISMLSKLAIRKRW